MVTKKEDAKTGPKPSIGRQVHYHGANDVPYAATIVKVHSDDCVNLHILPNGEPGEIEGATLKTSIVQGDEPGMWNWPPIV